MGPGARQLLGAAIWGQIPTLLLGVDQGPHLWAPAVAVVSAGRH